MPTSSATLTSAAVTTAPLAGSTVLPNQIYLHGNITSLSTSVTVPTGFEYGDFGSTNIYYTYDATTGTTYQNHPSYFSTGYGDIDKSLKKHQVAATSFAVGIPLKNYVGMPDNSESWHHILHDARCRAFAKITDSLGGTFKEYQMPVGGTSFGGAEIEFPPNFLMYLAGPHELFIKSFYVDSVKQEIIVEMMAPINDWAFQSWFKNYCHFKKKQEDRLMREKVMTYMRSNLVIKIKKESQERKAIDFSQVTPQEQKARESLRDMLSEAEWRRYVTNGFIMVKAQSGLWYQIFNKRSERLRVYKDNRHIETICIHSDESCPPTDHVINMKVLLELDEQAVRKGGNVNFIGNPNPVGNYFERYPDGRLTEEAEHMRVRVANGEAFEVAPGTIMRDADGNILDLLNQPMTGALRLNPDGSLPLAFGRVLSVEEVRQQITTERIQNHFRARGIPIADECSTDELRRHVANGVFEPSVLRNRIKKEQIQKFGLAPTKLIDFYRTTKVLVA